MFLQLNYLITDCEQFTKFELKFCKYLKKYYYVFSLIKQPRPS